MHGRLGYTLTSLIIDEFHFCSEMVAVQVVLKEKCDLWVALAMLKVVWRSVSGMNGEQCVTRCGM